MIKLINTDVSCPVIIPKDYLSNTPRVIKSLIVSFLQEVDSARFKEVSFKWKCFYQEKANEHSIRVQNLLQHIPRLIFRRQGYNSEISRILYISQKALVILERDGVFFSSNRKDWRNITPDGSFDSVPHIPIQAILQIGHIALAQTPSIYTVRLEDNTIVSKSPLAYPRLAEMVNPRPHHCAAVIQSNNNEKFYIYEHNIGYLDGAGHFHFFLEADLGFQNKIKKSVLQGNWLSVILYEDHPSKNTKLRVYDSQTKQLVFEENGEFYHTKNRLIVNNSKNILVFDMDSLDPEWKQNPVWVGTIENGRVQISACNDRYLILRTRSLGDKDVIVKKIMTGVAWDVSELKIFFKYIMLDLIDGSQESFTKRVLLNEYESVFLVQSFLFLYLDEKLDVIDLRLKKLIATNLEIPGFCLILDAKILDNELLIYFTTNDHLHCMLQFTLKDKGIPLAVEEADIKEKTEEVVNTPIVEDPPRELPSAPVAPAIPRVAVAEALPPPLVEDPPRELPSAPIAPVIPRVAAAEALPPPPLAPIENHAPNFLSSFWSKVSSYFSVIINFCIRIIRIFRK